MINDENGTEQIMQGKSERKGDPASVGNKITKPNQCSVRAPVNNIMQLGSSCLRPFGRLPRASPMKNFKQKSHRQAITCEMNLSPAAGY
jgi:hypothetical protein